MSDELIYKKFALDLQRSLNRDLQRSLNRARAFERICMDLDRCEHGRHEGDVCDGCGGASHGNPFHYNEISGDPLPIGYTIDGKEIIIPGRDDKYDPAKWISS
jgi:hypothetical protein